MKKNYVKNYYVFYYIEIEKKNLLNKHLKMKQNFLVNLKKFLNDTFHIIWFRLLLK